MVLKNTISSSAIRVVGCKSNKRRTTAGTRDELPVVIRFWMQAAHHHHKFQIVVVVVDGGTQEKCHLSSAGLAVPLAQSFRISKAAHGVQIQQTPASYFLQQS
jgi:hypothetical protein